MGGGIIQLVATGIPDLYLTGDPQITWFKVIYRRHAEFSMVDYPIKINGDPQLGSMHMINIAPIADKLNRVCLIVDVPSPQVEMSPPTVAIIQQITDKADLNLTFTPAKKSTDTITYEDLFNDDPTSIGSQIKELTKSLDTKYESRLDILDYISSTYSTSNDRYIGNHIAIEASGINFQALGTNIDIQGYVLLTSKKTRELYHSATKVIDLYEDAFMYYPELVEMDSFFVDPTRSVLGHIERSVIQSISKQYNDSSPQELGITENNELKTEENNELKTEENNELKTEERDELKTEEHDGLETDTRNIPATELSTPIGFHAKPVPTRLPTLDRMMKVYPRFVNGYKQISKIQDLTDIIDIDTKRYHIMLSIDFLRRVQKRNIYIRRLYLNSLDVAGATTDDVNQYLGQVKDTNLSDITQQSLLFNNFNYNEMLTDGLYETGIYLFEIDPSVLDVDYSTALMNVLDTGRLEIPIKYIDRATQTNPLINNQSIYETGVFNRYNINENAIYDPMWEIADLTVASVIDLDAPECRGYFMLNVDDLDNDPDHQQVIDMTTSEEAIADIITSETMIRFNPRFIHCNTDRMGFAPHTIKKKWDNSIVKNVLVKNNSNPNSIVKKQIKIENLLDGTTMIIKLFEDLYIIPSVINSVTLAERIAIAGINNKTSLYFLHSLLIAMHEDILNIQSQTRNYHLQDVKLYNVIDIKKEIVNKLFRDIIYVDQQKLGQVPDQYMSLFIRHKVFTINPLTGAQTQIQDIYNYLYSSDGYIYDRTNPSATPSPDAMVINRNNIYELTKYIMWTYYLENIYPIYDASIDNKYAIADFISILSYMLIQVPKIPVGIDPTNIASDRI